MTKKNAQKLNKLMCDLNPGRELYQKAVMANIDGRKMQCMYLSHCIIGLYDRNDLIETVENPEAEKLIQRYLTTKFPESYDVISFSVDDIKAAQKQWSENRMVTDPKQCVINLNGKLFDAEWVLFILEVLKNRDGRFSWLSISAVNKADYIGTDNGISVLCPMSRSLADRAIKVPVNIIDEVRRSVGDY